MAHSFLQIKRWKQREELRFQGHTADTRSRVSLSPASLRLCQWPLGARVASGSSSRLPGGRAARGFVSSWHGQGRKEGALGATNPEVEDTAEPQDHPKRHRDPSYHELLNTLSPCSRPVSFLRPPEDHPLVLLTDIPGTDIPRGVRHVPVFRDSPRLREARLPREPSRQPRGCQKRAARLFLTLRIPSRVLELHTTALRRTR